MISTMGFYFYSFSYQLFHIRCFPVPSHKLSRISEVGFPSLDFFNPRDQGKIRTRFVLEKQSTRDLNYWLNKNARKHP